MTTDELRAKLEQYITELRERAGNLLAPPVSKVQLGRASGYQHCADELQSLIEAATRGDV